MLHIDFADPRVIFTLDITLADKMKLVRVLVSKAQQRRGDLTVARAKAALVRTAAAWDEVERAEEVFVQANAAAARVERMIEAEAREMRH